VQPTSRDAADPRNSGPIDLQPEPSMPRERPNRMKRLMILPLAFLALSACGRSNGEAADDGAATMPELSFSVTENDDELDVVMEANVEFAADGSWERTGTDPGSGQLTVDEVERIAELVEAPDFPTDPDYDTICPAVMPNYTWILSTEDEQVSNGNGGCVSSDSAAEIVEIIQEAADVGPTRAAA
jgi:hypothetical protein